MELMVLGRINVVVKVAAWVAVVLGSWSHANSAWALAAAGNALVVSNKPLRGYKICIDPGHGGQSARDNRYTGGTFGVATRQTESDVNLRVSLMLAQYLEEAGARVYLTRTTDNRVQDKADMASELDARSRYANSRGSDLFISMHHNHGPRGTNYTAVFYHRNSPKSAKLADQISASLAFCLGTPNIGARSSAYRVLRDLRMPGVIVECSFMTNAAEDSRLANLSYNKLQAKGVAVGIINFVRQTRGRGVDFTSVFGPLDELGNRTQVVADSTYRGEGPPPSLPFVGRTNPSPLDSTALASTAAFSESLEPTETDIRNTLASGGQESNGLSAELAPLPTGAPTRLEAIRQKAAQSSARGSHASNQRARPTASAEASRKSLARLHSTMSISRGSNKNSGSSSASRPSTSSRRSPSSANGRVVARSSGASRTLTAKRPDGTGSSRPAGSSASRPSTGRPGSANKPSSGSTGARAGSATRSTGARNNPAPKPRQGRASVSYSRR
jgi:N-acetylmuramoyl-L-alanine amidase